MKKITYLLSSVLALGLIFTSCVDIGSDDSSSTTPSVSADKNIGFTKISIADNSRTAFPEFDRGNLTNIKLIATKDDVDTVYPESGDGYSYADLTDLSLPIPAGEYDFKLEAMAGGIKLSSEKKSQTIKADNDNKLTFELAVSDYKAEEGNGSINIRLKYTGSTTIHHVTRTVYTNYASGTVHAATETVAPVSGAYTYADSAIPSGNYTIEFVFYGDEAEKQELGSYTVLAIVSKDLTTTDSYTISTLDDIAEVSFDLDGGKYGEADSIDPVSCIEGQEMTLPMEGFTKAGYDFEGWYKDGSPDVVYTNEDGHKLTGSSTDITLKAKWTPKTYTITYRDSDENEISGLSPAEYTIEDSVDLPALADLDPTLTEGKELRGWDDGSSVITYWNKRSGDVTLTVSFKPKTYKVTFNVNDGTPDVAPQTVEHKETIDVSKVTEPSKPDFTFICWTKDDVTDPSYAGTPTPFDIESEEITEEITLYAYYKSNSGTFKVEYYQESLDGTTSVDYPADPDDSDDSVKGPIGETPNYESLAAANLPEGFEFDSDTTDSENGSTVIADDGSTVVKIYYKRKTITYTFDYAGGTGLSQPLSGKYGESVPTVAEPTRSGYRFGGWTPSPVPATFGSEDKTFTASWN